MVKIISHSGAPIGSTVALVSLCNHLNKAGYKCVLYAPDYWYADKCPSGDIRDFRPEKGDAVIVNGIDLYSTSELSDLSRHLEDNKGHGWQQAFRKISRRYFSRAKTTSDHRLILTCQGDNPARYAGNLALYSAIHFVDEAQRLGGSAGLKSFVCPNPVEGLKTSANKPARTAGIIATIKRQNKIEQCIAQACAEGMEKIIIFGHLADPLYYYKEIRPVVESSRGKVQFAGFIDDKQAMYDSISDVYSPSSKPSSPVRREAAMTGTYFHAPSSADLPAMTNQKIMSLWMEAIGPRQ